MGQACSSPTLPERTSSLLLDSSSYWRVNVWTLGNTSSARSDRRTRGPHKINISSSQDGFRLTPIAPFGDAYDNLEQYRED